MRENKYSYPNLYNEIIGARTINVKVARVLFLFSLYLAVSAYPKSWTLTNQPLS